MIIDISSNNGVIDWREVVKQDIQRVIFRSTTRNNKFDTRFIDNLNAYLAESEGAGHFELYKFSYARTYGEAMSEALVLFQRLKSANIFMLTNKLWLDLEKWGDRDYYQKEANDVILAYSFACKVYGYELGIYCSHSYLNNVLPDWVADAKIPLWVARWNNYLGSVKPYNVELWQYTSKGSVKGINGNVDLSKKVTSENEHI